MVKGRRKRDPRTMTRCGEASWSSLREGGLRLNVAGGGENRLGGTTVVVQ